MRTIFRFSSLLLCMVLVSCTLSTTTKTPTITLPSTTIPPTQTIKPTSTIIPPTQTAIPTVTPIATQTITPTLMDEEKMLQPELGGMQIPWSDVAITSENANQIALLATWQPYDVASIAFSPDGQMVALGLQSGPIKLLSVANGQELRTLTGHRFWVISLAFSPDGGILASEAGDKSTRLWDVSTGEELYYIEGGSEAGWGRGGKPAVDFSPDGRLLAFAGPNGQVRLWDAVNHAMLRPLKADKDAGFSGEISAIAFSPDGEILAIGYAKPNIGATPSIIQLITLWDPVSSQELRTLEYSGDQTSPNISSLEFSPDGRMLASGYFEAKIKLWDVASGRVLYTLTDPWQGEISRLVFSPSGDVLAICSDMGEFMLVEPSNGKELVNFANPADALAFSPDGKVLISGSSTDGVVRLWGVPTQASARMPISASEVEKIASAFEDITQAYAKAWNSYDFDAMEDLYTDDIVFSDLTLGDYIVGRHGVISMAHLMHALYPDMKRQITNHYIGLEDSLCVAEAWGLMGYTQDNSYFGMALLKTQIDRIS